MCKIWLWLSLLWAQQYWLNQWYVFRMFIFSQLIFVILLTQKMHFMPLKSYHTESNVYWHHVCLSSPYRGSLSSSAGSTADRPFSLNPSTGRDETANISVPELRPEPRKSHGSVRDNKKHPSVNYRPKKTVYKWSVYELQHKSSDTATVSNYAAMNGQSLSTMWGEWTSAGEESWVT